MRFLAVVVAVILAVTVCSDFSDARKWQLNQLPPRLIRLYADHLALISSKMYARRLTRITMVVRELTRVTISFQAVETTCKPSIRLPSPKWCPRRKNGPVFACTGTVMLLDDSHQRVKFPKHDMVPCRVIQNKPVQRTTAKSY